MYRFLSWAGVAALISCVALPSFAVPITFIHTGFGSGTLNGQAFGAVGAPVPFTITETSDTSLRQSLGVANGFFIDDLTASISITGLGVFDFVTGTRTFVNNDISKVGFARAGANGTDLFDGPSDPAFGTWDMFTAIGPISGPGDIGQWNPSFPTVNTNAGVLIFNTSTTDATFQAIVATVPESGTLSLAILGLGLAGFALRRHTLD